MEQSDWSEERKVMGVKRREQSDGSEERKVNGAK